MPDDLGEALSRALLRDKKFEVGGGIGYGSNRSNDQPVDTQTNDSSGALQAYALMRNNLLGLEGGYLRLPSYSAKFSTGDYPAYKLAAQGMKVSYPQTARVTQDINATAPYVRGNIYGPNILGVEPYAFGGLAKVRTDNHENALYNGVDVNDYREVMKRNAKLYGLGVNLPMGKDWNARAELLRIPHAADEYHTGDRNINMGLIGVGRQF